MTQSRLLVLAGLMAGLSAPALAQTPIHNQLAKGNAKAAPERAPAALPGARPGPGVGKPIAGTAGMKPNEALFDSVNRGDIASAREALGRGADVDSRNVLGLTPVELSVDLGRNDITFLLLSMRGSGSGRASAAPPVASAPIRVAAVAPAPRVTPARIAAAPMVSANPAPGRDPGVPAPQAGFLGFGSPR